MKMGEKVYRLIARWDIQCEECGITILAGKPFILDQIPYYEASSWGAMKRVHNHKICENCWRGPKNVIIDLTNKPRSLRSPKRHPFSRKRATWIAKVTPWRNY